MAKSHTPLLPITMTVATKEFDAILAGLRSLQHLLETDALPLMIRGILIDTGPGLGITEIDTLRQRINCA